MDFHKKNVENVKHFAIRLRKAVELCYTVNLAIIVGRLGHDIYTHI
jgi:hypothetical protein